MKKHKKNLRRMVGVKRRQRKYEWEKIKDEFVFGDDNVSYTNLAHTHKIPYRTLYDRATNDKWYEQRMKFRIERDDHAKQEVVLRHSRELLKSADFFMILRGALASFLEKKTKKGNTAVLTLDEVEQITECLATNTKATKLLIGEHTGIVKVDENLTYEDIIKNKRKERGLDGNGKKREQIPDLSTSSQIDVIVKANDKKNGGGNGKKLKKSFLRRLRENDDI